MGQLTQRWQRPGLETTAGDHERRIGILERQPVGGSDSASTYSGLVLGEASLQSYWPLDDASGDAIDHGPLGIDLTPDGTPTYGEPGPFADDPATSILFDSPESSTLVGLDRFSEPGLVGGSAFTFNGTATYTFEALIAPTAYTSLISPVMSNGDHQGTGSLASLTLAVFSDGRLIAYRAGQSVTGSALPLGVWTHIAVTYDGATLKLYANGGLVASLATTNPETTQRPLWLGVQRSSGANYYTYLGRMAQVAIYNTALSAATLLAHAEAGVLAAIQLANIHIVTAAYTVAASDDVVFADGTFTVTLPTAVAQPGRQITIKNTGTGTITVGRTSAQTIDGAASNLSMATTKMARQFTSDGSGWQITAAYL
jgi:hypothetical protein